MSDLITNTALTRRHMLAGAAALAVSPGLAHAQSVPPDLARWVDSPSRSANNRARDHWRKPGQTIAFLGIKPTDTVVEVLPGSVGYWLEILAPYLRDKGRYIAAGRDEAATENYRRDHERLLAKLAAEPDLYGKVVVTKFNADKHPIAPDGSADHVLTFRNLHNWIERKEVEGSLRAFHRALKPGGSLGVADHRGRIDRSQEAQMSSGYVREDVAFAYIENAGFRRVASSEIKSNPNDTKDHENGVWSLPPTFRGGDKDRAKYQAIGESDRFLLKFRKV